MIFVGIITSDYQVRVRGGRWMGFDNASWDLSNRAELLAPHLRVDVNHKRGRSISGAMLEIESFTTTDFDRTQANWTTPRPVDYVLASFYLLRNSLASSFATKAMDGVGRLGVSIEHGGRKPRRTIGPCVTITSNPWNRDCWMIYDSKGSYVYPRSLESGSRLLTDDGLLPASVTANAIAMLSRTLSKRIEVVS